MIYGYDHTDPIYAYPVSHLGSRGWIMIKKAIAGMIVGITVSCGYGVRECPADNNLIAADSTLPPVGVFQAALNQHMEQLPKGYFGRTCVSAAPDSQSERRGTFKDTHFDHTPVGFLVSTDVMFDPNGARRAQLPYLEKQGFLESKPNKKGGIDYSMTWKGYAATNGYSCFFIHSDEREAKVIKVERKRADKGIEFYEVTAGWLLKGIEPWAQGEEFGRLFPYHVLGKIKPDRVIKYEMARGDRGFVILKVNDIEYQPPNFAQAALMAKMAGTLTPDQVRKAVASFVTEKLNASAENKLCLKLPGQDEVDQIILNDHKNDVDPNAPVAMFDVYHIPGRFRDDNAPKLRGYVRLRRLEALGLVHSRILNYSEFRGVAALGGVRFEVKKEAADKFAPNLRGCYALNSYRLEEIIRFDQFSPTGGSPGFIARVSVHPIDDDAMRAINEFGHFSRVAAVGAALIGGMTFKEGGLQVGRAQVRLPTFQPNVSEDMVPAITEGLVTPRDTALENSRQAPDIQLRNSANSSNLSGNSMSPRRDANSPAMTSGIEVHSVRVYEGAVRNEALPRGFGEHPGRSVMVYVFPTTKPIGLFLTAYEPVNWVIELKPGARLARVVTSGYYQQRVTFMNSTNVPVATTTYSGREETNPSAAERAFGIKPTTTNYQYTGKSFDVGPP